MTILVTGANGLVGKALMQSLSARGDSPTPLVRGRMWTPETGELHLAQAFDAVVHLAGESIAAKRWSAEQKRRIRTSRVEATERLARSIAKLQPRPSVFISASAVGYYGNRADELLTETSPPGTDFLAQVAQEWEAATAPLVSVGVRVVHLRFGMILSRDGGALARMLPIFKAGFGGRLASGSQWMSWITLRDVVRLIEWCLDQGEAAGAYNAVAPTPVTNAEFTRALSHALHRPAFVLVPAPALRLAFGEMAEALLLPSQRAVPERLTAAGFQFLAPDLSEGLRQVLR